MEDIDALGSPRLRAELIEVWLLAKLRMQAPKLLGYRQLLGLVKRLKRNSPIEKRLIDEKIDLVYFLSSSSWATSLVASKYIQLYGICTIAMVQSFPKSAGSFK